VNGMRQTVLAGLALLVLLVPAPAQAQSGRPTFRAVRYVMPVEALVIDPFRPPAHIGAPGNRGLEFGNDHDHLVVAAADGLVTFAGSVAGRQIITVHHPDNVRTTYTGMSEVWVAENGHVEQGESIGRADANLHFGARSGRHYLDPQVLLDASTEETRARLLPTSNPN